MPAHPAGHDHFAPLPDGVDPVDLTDPVARSRVHALMGTCEKVDGHLPFGDHELLAIAFGTSHDHIGFGVAREGVLAGYGHLSRLGAAWFCEVAVDPAFRGQGLSSLLLDAIVSHVAVHGGGSLSTWAYTMSGGVAGLVAHGGFREARVLLQMRLPELPVEAPPLPRPLTLERFVPGRDEDEWLSLNARAFAQLPDQGAWDRSELATRMAASWFRASDVLMVRRDGRLVATCWTKLDPAATTHEGEQMGEIYVIGVDPSEPRGLGRPLATAGLVHLRERGATVGMLYADAANTRAVDLYASMGFRVHHRDVCLVTDVEGAGVADPA